MRPASSVLSKLRLRQLALILYTSDAGSLAEGAARSNVSQPAATKMLHEAELLFGGQLFERTPKGMLPTPIGEVVISYARTVVTDLVRVSKDVDAIESGASGSIAVGTIPGAGPTVLGHAISRLTQAHPGITVHVRVETSDSLVPMLLDGELDFVIGRPHGTAARELKFERLDRDASQPVVVGIRHPLAQSGQASAAQLRQLQWILHPPGNLLRIATDEAFRNIDLQPATPTVETISYTFALALLQQTQLAAIMPPGLAGLYEASNLLRILRTPLGVHLGPFGILTRHGREFVPAANTLLGIIRKECRTPEVG